MNKRQHQKTRLIYYPETGFTVGSGARYEKVERKRWRKIKQIYYFSGIKGKRRLRQLAKISRYMIRHQEERYLDNDVETLYNYFFDKEDLLNE